MTPDDLDTLVGHMKRTGSFLKGSFVLASGRKSNAYLDCRRLTLDPQALPFVVSKMTHMLAAHGHEPNCVGGLTSGADPLVAGFLMNGWRSMNGFYSRKEYKLYGTCKKVEGHLSPGDRVVIVDDVISTGGSIARVADDVIDAGATVVCAIAVVSRDDIATEALGSYLFPLHSLISLSDLDRRFGE